MEQRETTTTTTTTTAAAAAAAGTQVYVFFAIFRCINALLIQSQFDPDEYWQNLEPAYCHVFHTNGGSSEGKPCPGLTWEWKRRSTSPSSATLMTVKSLQDAVVMGLEGPVRSYISALPTILFYYLLKTMAWDTTFLVSKGPILVNAILVAAPTDWAVWYMSRWLQEAPTTRSDDTKMMKGNLANWCIYCTITSWFWAYALVRTYSNSLETVIWTFSLVLVSKVRGSFD